jgi:hypothetical protein
MRYTCRRCGKIGPEPYCERHAPAQQRSKSGFSFSNHDRNKQKVFRAQVLERDGYTCRMCGAAATSADSDRGRPAVSLIAHHTTPVLDLPEAQRYDPKHGLTLCKACHRAADPRAR